MKDFIKYCDDTKKRNWGFNNFYRRVIKKDIGKEEYSNIEEAILQKEETTKRIVKPRKSKKFNYLKYTPVNENILQPNEIVVHQENSKLSYANALKQNINHKPPTNNTTDRTSEKPTLQHQLQSFSAKLIKRNT